MVRVEALFLALLLCSPAFYQAFVTEERTVENALIRYVVVAVACTVGVNVLRNMYLQFASAIPRRRLSDAASSQPATAGGQAPAAVVSATVVDVPAARDAGHEAATGATGASKGRRATDKTR